MNQIRQIVRRIPVVNTLARLALSRLRRWRFSSGDYWENRYQSGGTSGAGSYGQLAEFKAEVLNDFVRKNAIQSVIEFGCGDGNQLSLAEYPAYIGLDVSRTAIQMCLARFKDDPTKSFFLYDSRCFADRQGVFQAELALSLDVIFHLIEDEIFDLYMRHLFGAARRYVVIYSSNSTEGPATTHVRHRRFSDWVEAHMPGWTLVETIPNRYPFQGDATTGSISDFFIYRKA